MVLWSSEIAHDQQAPRPIAALIKSGEHFGGGRVLHAPACCADLPKRIIPGDRRLYRDQKALSRTSISASFVGDRVYCGTSGCRICPFSELAYKGTERNASLFHSGLARILVT